MKNLFTILISVFAFSGFAQDGTSDVTFGTNGIASLNFIGDDEHAATEVLPNGKILVLSETYSSLYGMLLPTVTRLNTDGSLDLSFGTNGSVAIQAITIWNNSYALTFDAQNRPIVVLNGDDQLEVIRLLENGTIDTDFDFDGRAIADLGPEQEHVTGVKVRPNGKIVLVCAYGLGFGAAQFNSNGSLDNTFGVSGIISHTVLGTTNVFQGMALQDNGKILVCGRTTFVWGKPMSIYRLNADGSIDNTFDDDGVKHRLVGLDETFGYEVHVYPDGKTLVAGLAKYSSTERRGFLAAFDVDGSGYDMFGSTDIVTLNLSGGLDWFTTLTVQNDGKILAAGHFNYANPVTDVGFWAVRFNADGTLDPTFSNDGSVVTYLPGRNVFIEDMCLTPEGDVILGARNVLTTSADSDMALLKLTAGLAVSITESNTVDFNIYPNPTSEALIVNLAELNGNNASIRVVDALGKEVISTSDVKGNNTTLNVNHLVKGTYFGTVTSGSETGSFQFVKN
ncbi:MAG: T9SS type A sorting domain-containing protein [Flavobacteriales bacterium]